MIKKLSFLFAFLFPFFLGIVFIFVKTDNKNKTVENKNVIDDKFFDQNSRNEFLIDDFININEKYFDEQNYQSLKLKAFDEKLEFNKLSKKIQNTLILSKCISVNKKFKQLKDNIGQTDTIQDKIKDFQKKINNTIDKQIKSLYSEYGSNLHPVDKIFLDKIYE